jgi:hypothetical protein
MQSSSTALATAILHEARKVLWDYAECAITQEIAHANGAFCRCLWLRLFKGYVAATACQDTLEDETSEEQHQV